jgi:quercetin dioxygenase-like cupin family protein
MLRAALVLTATIAMSAFTVVVARAQLAGTRIPGGCDVPASERAGSTGCYLVATAPLGKLPSASVFWHLYRYPSRAAAEAAKGPNSTVVESLGHLWVYTIAGKDWKPSAGERIDVLGPLQVSIDKPYTARYMEAVFAPGMQTSVHRHSGAEAWYVLAGAQCLETPDRIIVAKAGEGAVVPQGPPMALSGVGAETRRSVLLVLHESSEPWMTVTSDWTPTGRCPK